MQPSPSHSLLAAAAPRLRAWTLVLHGSLFVSLLALGACRDAKVTAYETPKEATAPAPKAQSPHGSMPSAPASGDAAMASQAVPTAAGPSLTWTAPAHWQSRQGSTMRKATFAVVGEGGATADLAVTAFPGDVGGDAANVNRWRGQVGLPALGEAEALASIQRLEVNGLKVGIVDIGDPAANGVHMLGAMVPFEGATWFFKLLGPAPLVTSQKEAFVEFVKTLKPAPVAVTP